MAALRSCAFARLVVRGVFKPLNMTSGPLALARKPSHLASMASSSQDVSFNYCPSHHSPETRYLFKEENMTASPQKPALWKPNDIDLWLLECLLQKLYAMDQGSKSASSC